MNTFTKILIPFFLLFFFTQCKKEDSIKATKSQEDIILEYLSNRSNDTSILSASDRQFMNEIRAIANDIEALYTNVDNSLTLQQRYNILKSNMTNRIALVTQKATTHYSGSLPFIILTQNSFTLMSYDALERYNNAFMWTKLGVFAANEVRNGVVLIDLMLDIIKKNNIHIVMNPANGQEMDDVLLEASQILIGGQLEVLTDIGSLALLNKFGADKLALETWLTPEAQNGFRIQHQAELALKAGNILAYQNLQTEAAVEFGAHEQIYILQKLWDNPLMQQLASINKWLLDISKGKFAVFGEIFIGVNKYIELEKGYVVKLPNNSFNLVNATHRVDIARNGFNTLNTLRKDPKWSYWIDYSQIRIGYYIDVYYPRGVNL